MIVQFTLLDGGGVARGLSSAERRNRELRVKLSPAVVGLLSGLPVWSSGDPSPRRDRCWQKRSCRKAHRARSVVGLALRRVRRKNPVADSDTRAPSG